jgi:predicted metal-dependent phosphoesterase TrpH
MRLDLHIHTQASDGAWTAESVVSGAARGRLDVIAITDHDTTAGVEAARVGALRSRVQIIPALEVSSTHGGRDIHVLGYFVDPNAQVLLQHAARASRIRVTRMQEILDRLRLQGIDVTLEEVEQAAGPVRVTIGRPHLADVLVTRGFTKSIPEAFNVLIGDHCPAFVPTRLMEPTEAVELVRAAGGIPVWAHPPADLMDELLPALVRAGLEGLEVYRPSHAKNDIRKLEGIARTAGLLVSGGSDWHTPDAGSSLGDFHVTGDEVEKLLTAGGM